MNKKHLLVLCACLTSGFARADPHSARGYGEMLARHFCEGAPSIIGTGVEPSVVICFPPAINSQAERTMCKYSMKEHVLRHPTCSKFHATRLPAHTPYKTLILDYYQRLEKNCGRDDRRLREQNEQTSMKMRVCK